MVTADYFGLGSVGVVRRFVLIVAVALACVPGWAWAGTGPPAPPIDAPEAALLKSIDTLRQGDLSGGMNTLESLVQRHPNFRLAQLLYGQLLAERSGVPAANRSLMTPADKTALKGLQAEYRARLAAPEAVPAAGRVPSNILKLSTDAPYAVVVDLRRSRLYLLAHKKGSFEVLRSYYATIARDGYGKLKTGDMRTPVGVYRITSWKPGKALGAIYGAGAFPVNYPNAWDRAHGRTGYGIWLHGVPHSTYARPPLDSEGCVALANRDLLALKPYLQPGNKVPVIFSDDLKWQPAAAGRAERATLSAAIHGWRRAWSNGDTDAYLAYYAADFHTAKGVSRSRFAESKRRLGARKRYIHVAVKDLSLFRYPGTQNVVLAQFTQVYASDDYADTTHKQQFWKRQPDGSWQIVFMASGNLPHPSGTK